MKPKIVIAILLESLAEAGGEAASGWCYAALMNHIDLDFYNQLIGAMCGDGFITHQHHVLTLTPKGYEWAEKIAEARRIVK